MEQNKLLIPIAIIVAGAFIAGAIYLGGNSGERSDNNVPPAGQINIAPVTDKDHILGSRNAPIVVVEYSDLECPFCKDFHYTMKEVVSNYNGQVSWVFRHFPIPQLHTKAMKEAEATECAAELGDLTAQADNQAFWNYLDKIFETTNSNDSLDLDELPRIATAIGLDEAAFNECLESERYNDFIMNSIEEGVTAGARGTPYSVIITKEGQKTVINGAEPIESVKAKIDALLK